MARVSDQKRAELESFWRGHHEGWQASDLNQREYCELHGLPLKRFGNWRAQFKDEETVAHANLLWRRGGGLRHVSGHMSNKEIAPVSSGYVTTCKNRTLTIIVTNRLQISQERTGSDAAYEFRDLSLKIDGEHG